MKGLISLVVLSSFAVNAWALDVFDLLEAVYGWTVADFRVYKSEIKNHPNEPMSAIREGYPKWERFNNKYTHLSESSRKVANAIDAAVQDKIRGSPGSDDFTLTMRLRDLFARTPWRDIHQFFLDFPKAKKFRGELTDRP